jgi:serine phosphatase RsbU (regulator of sigma subunit)
MFWLEFHDGDGQSRRVPFESGATLKVGRSPDNDVVLAGDQAVSRFHAELSLDGERCEVRDVGSSNGTLVDSRRITGPTELVPGAWAQVGETTIRLVAGSSDVRVTDDKTAAVSGHDMGQSVMLPVDEVVDSVQRQIRRSPQMRAFATLSKASRMLLGQEPLEAILERIVDLVYDIASPDRGAVMLLEGDPPELRVAASRGVTDGDGGLAISRTIADLVVEESKAVMTVDAQIDDRFDKAASVMAHNIRSAMCVPLWNSEHVIGLIYVDTQRGAQAFNKDDLEALTLVANVVAVKIHNIRLFQQEQRMKEIERELRAASRIQQRLLPAQPPAVPGYELYGYNRPCLDVGGDYFDYLLRDEKTLTVVVGDVSGKGLGAALLMASIQASLHAHVSTPASVEELVTQLNRAVHRSSSVEKFSTFFYAEIDIESGALRFCNAGHNPPLIVRAGSEIEMLQGGGMVLGFNPAEVYTASDTRLEPGDLLVAYSDGVTEAVNVVLEQFGEERLMATVRETAGVPVEQVSKRIDEAVAAFVGEADPFDDYTLLLVRRLS